jgi:hypothetical protein
MALDPGRRSVSPESSGHESPKPRQWRNQLGSGKCSRFVVYVYRILTLDAIAEDAPPKDRHYRKYANGIERTLSLFDTALQEWADYISFLNRLLKVGISETSSGSAPF